MPRKKKKTLTKRQKAILDFIRSFLTENGFPPTVREIGEAVSISSTSVVSYNLNRLVERGHLLREKELSRGLRLTSDIPSLSSRVGFTRIPMAGPIVAGEPVEIGESVFDEEDAIELSNDLLAHHDDLFALKVRGDSMIDAMVSDGDIVVMRPQKEARDGEMIAAWLTDRDETTLKYFYHEGGRIRLQPANPTMDPIFVDPSVVQVQGKVLLVVRQIN
ncbi:MAG: transcriptional repressor LexA [Chloroflexota bacterium]